MPWHKKPSEESAPTTPEVRAWPRRLLTWAWRSTEVTILLLALCVGGIFWLLANLDKPVLSEPITGYVKDNLGLTLSYRTLKASPLSNVQGEDLVIAQPGPFLLQAPFLQLDRLAMQWVPSSLLTAQPRLGPIQMEGLRITLVEDETGANTLSLLFPSEPESTTPTPPAPPTPFSQLLDVVPAGLILESFDLHGISFEQRTLQKGQPVGSLTFKGGRLLLRARPNDKGEGKLELKILATDEEPFELHIQPPPTETNTAPSAQHVRATLQADVVLEGRTLSLSLNLSKLEQNFMEFPLRNPRGPANTPTLPLPADPLVLKTQLQFDPQQQQTRVVVESLRLLGSVLQGQLSAVLKDLPNGGVKPELSRSALQLDLKTCLPLLGVDQNVLSLEQGTLGIELSNLLLHPETFMPEGGQVLLSGELRNLDLRPSGVPLTLGSLKTEGALLLEANPASDKSDTSSSLGGKLSLNLPLERLRYQVPGMDLRWTRGRLALELTPLLLRLDDPPKSTAEVDLRLSGQGLDLTLDKDRLQVGQFAQTLKTHYPGKLLEHAALQLTTEQLSLSHAGQASAALPSLKLSLELPTLRISADQPLASRFVGTLELNAQHHRLAVELQREQAPLQLGLKVAMADFTMWQPLLRALTGETTLPPLAPLELQVQGKARLENGPLSPTQSSPLSLQQQTALVLKGLSFRTATQALNLPTLTLETDARGSLEKLLAEATVRIPSVQARLQAKAEAGKAPPLPTRMEGQELFAKLSGTYSPSAPEGIFTLQAKRLEYQDDIVPVVVQQLTQTLKMQSYQQRSSVAYLLNSKAHIDRLEQPYSSAYPPGDLSWQTTFRFVPDVALRVDQLELSSQQNGTKVELNAALDLRPSEQTRGLEGVASARSLAEAAPLLEKPELQGVVQIQGGQVLALQGTLSQALEPLSHQPEQLQGTGTLRATVQLESPDQQFVRLRSQIQMDQVSLKMPQASLNLQGLNGRIDVEEAIRQTAKGWELVLSDQHNLFTRASFSEIQPFLETESYFSADKIQYQELLFESLSGNLQIEQDQIRLNQLETSFKEGLLTGQLLIDYAPQESQVLFRGNATQLKLSSARERFDANFALGLSTRKLDLQGQMQVVRIGQQTLIESLDLFDPYHEDVTYNRVRKGLQVGYPEFVRLRFEYGLMSAQLKLGGAAATLRIDELKGIPVGPLLSSTLGPYLATE